MFLRFPFSRLFPRVRINIKTWHLRPRSLLPVSALPRCMQKRPLSSQYSPKTRRAFPKSHHGNRRIKFRSTFSRYYWIFISSCISILWDRWVLWKRDAARNFANPRRRSATTRVVEATDESSFVTIMETNTTSSRLAFNDEKWTSHGRSSQTGQPS